MNEMYSKSIGHSEEVKESKVTIYGLWISFFALLFFDFLEFSHFPTPVLRSLMILCIILLAKSYWNNKEKESIKLTPENTDNPSFQRSVYRDLRFSEETNKKMESIINKGMLLSSQKSGNLKTPMKDGNNFLSSDLKRSILKDPYLQDNSIVRGNYVGNFGDASEIKQADFKYKKGYLSVIQNN